MQENFNLIGHRLWLNSVALDLRVPSEDLYDVLAREQARGQTLAQLFRVSVRVAPAEVCEDEHVASVDEPRELLGALPRRRAAEHLDEHALGLGVGVVRS